MKLHHVRQAIRQRGRRSLVVGVALVVALVVASAVALSSPNAAEAGDPVRFEDRSISFSCADAQTELGTVRVVGAYIGLAPVPFVGYIEVVYWGPGTVPDSEPPTLEAGFEATLRSLTETATETALAVEIPFVDPATFDVVGTGTFSAQLVPLGEPASFDEQSRDGNRLVRTTGTFQPITGTARLELPNAFGTFTFSSCQGVIFDRQTFMTNPDTMTGLESVHNSVGVDCTFENAAGDVGSLYFSGVPAPQGSDVFGFLLVSLDPAGSTPSPDEPPTYFGFENVELSRNTIAATIPLLDRSFEVAGSATVDASLVTAGMPVLERRVYQHGGIKYWMRPMTLEGTIVFSTGQTFQLDAESCHGFEVVKRSTLHTPSGPHPGGTVPPNDTPLAAEAVEIGTQFNVQTGGAAPSGEVAASCTTGGFLVGAAEISYTLWYELRGTGTPVTIDTAGSNFDTVVAVYVKRDGEFVEVACVDDVPSLNEFGLAQARVTIETEPGETYYVQVGGWSGDFGRLRLSVG